MQRREVLVPAGEEERRVGVVAMFVALFVAIFLFLDRIVRIGGSILSTSSFPPLELQPRNQQQQHG